MVLIREQHTNTILTVTFQKFPCKPRLASCPLDSQSPVILILSFLTG